MSKDIWIVIEWTNDDDVDVIGAFRTKSLAINKVIKLLKKDYDEIIKEHNEKLEHLDTMKHKQKINTNNNSSKNNNSGKYNKSNDTESDSSGDELGEKENAFKNILCGETFSDSSGDELRERENAFKNILCKDTDSITWKNIFDYVIKRINKSSWCYGFDDKHQFKIVKKILK